MLIGIILKLDDLIQVIGGTLFGNILLYKLIKPTFEDPERGIRVQALLTAVVNGEQRVLVDGAAIVGVDAEQVGLLAHAQGLQLLYAFYVLKYGWSVLFCAGLASFYWFWMRITGLIRIHF